MTTAKRFEELEVWQGAREITNLVYKLSGSGAFSKNYGLRDQMQRSAVSIMSNIAEGFESRTQSLFIDFLGRARGSAGELRSQLFVAYDCNYIQQDDFQKLRSLLETCSRRLAKFIQYLESCPNARRVGEEEGSYDV